MNFTKREIAGIFLVLVVGLFSWGAWHAFFAVVMTPGISDIWRVVLWFFLLAVFFFLGTVLWTNLFLRMAGAALVFLPGLLFINSWEYTLAGVIAVAFIFWSSAAIAQETEERISFRFFKSARVGQFLFIFGLSLVISGGYYVFLKNAVWEELVPRFQVGKEMTGIIFKVAGAINPSFAKLSEGEMTVDEFLLSLEQNKPGENSGDPGKKINENMVNVSPQMMSQYLNGKNAVSFSGLNQEEIAQKLFLESGREQVATLVDRPVAGNEKISDVLSLALQNKLITLLSGGKSTQHIPSQAVPFFLSLLLFLTLLSLASVFAPLCIFGAQIFFGLLLWSGWLTISTFSVEQEKLAD